MVKYEILEQHTRKEILDDKNDIFSFANESFRVARAILLFEVYNFYNRKNCKLC